MSTDFSTALGVMQHSDSFFPSGAVSFSYGLETLFNDGRATDAEQVKEFVLEQLLYRWTTVDRSILAAVFEAGDDLEHIIELDQLLEAVTLTKELREGSHRSGKALLSVYGKLGSQKVTDYEELVRSGKTPGHLAVVQALAWSDAGFGLDECCMISAHTLCVGILGAAVRLGIIGHIAAQQILLSIRPQLTEGLNSEIPAVEEISAFTPISEAASMRHEHQMSRLFAN